jgi:magnesium transporter
LLRIHRRRELDDLSTLSGELPSDAVWIDLLNPSDDEKRSVERTLSIRIPSQEALSEIEASSRLISDYGKLYLSSPAVRQDEFGDPYLTPIGFIVGSNILVTVRFAALPILDTLAERIRRAGAHCATGRHVRSSALPPPCLTAGATPVRRSARRSSARSCR